MNMHSSFTNPIIIWVKPRRLLKFETTRMDSKYRTAFIDTNLDTHLAIAVSSNDNILEIKRKIISEHPKCFPEIGQIQVQRIKVKRKGYFFHLSDEVLVRNVLKSFQKNWFLTADVSALGDCRQNEMLVSDRVESLGIGNNNALVGTQNNSIRLLQLENKQDESEQIHVGRFGVLGDIAKEGEQITGDRRRVNHEVPSSDKGNAAYEPSTIKQWRKRNRKSKNTSSKKKHKSKKRKKEDTVQDYSSKENDTYVVVPGDYTVQQDSSEKAAKEVIKETEIFKEHLHTECNDIDAVLMEEASKPISAVIKKHKKRKTHNSKELLKVTSPKDAAQITHEAHMETKESKGQSELNKDKSGHDVEYKHNKTEDILDTCRPAKKRKKSRKKSLSYKKLPNDLNGEKSSPRPNIKNNTADHLAENVDGANQLETSGLGQGKKETMNSSDLDEAPIVTLSRVNEEGHHSSIQREDIIMSKMTVDKMEIGTDACKVSSQSIMERKGSDIEMNVPSSEENEPKDLSDDNENVVLGHCHERGAGQTEEAKEGKGVSPSNKVNTDSGIKELRMTSNGTNGQVLDNKNEHDVQTIQPGTKVPNVPKTRHSLKFSSLSDTAMSSIDQNRKLRNNASKKCMDLERQREQVPISKSNLNKIVQNKTRKAFTNNVGVVVSKTQQNPILLGTIFDDNSSGTSAGEDRVDYSDASTRTLSGNNSLLSEFSDGDSQQNGSSGKSMENCERSFLKAGFSIGRVIRSSVMYKIAKIKASQMDESEIQQEFIFRRSS